MNWIRTMWHENPERPLSVLLFVGVMLFWEGAIRGFGISGLIIPPPSAVAQSLYEGAINNILITNTLVTFSETVLGFALGGALGLLLGGLIAQFPLVEKTLYPYIVAFQTIPKIAIAPIIVIWFGFGMSSKVIISAAIAFFPLLANTIAGLRSVPQDQVELLVAFTASRWQVFRMARIPQSLPYVFVGLDVAIVLSVIGAIAGEFVGAQAGLGYLILQRNFNMDMAGVFAVLTILSVMGIGLHVLVRTAQRKVVFWMEEEQDRVMGA